MFAFIVFGFLFSIIVVTLFTVVWSIKWELLGGMIVLGLVKLIAYLFSLNLYISFTLLALVMIFALGYKFRVEEHPEDNN